MVSTAVQSRFEYQVPQRRRQEHGRMHSSEHERQDADRKYLWRLLMTIALAGTPLLACAVYVEGKIIYDYRLKDFSKYRERERARKAWNKSAKEEERRRHVMGCMIFLYSAKHKLPIDEELELQRLNCTVLIPARKRMRHPALHNIPRLWDIVLWKWLGRGYFKDFTLRPEQRITAMRRAEALSTETETAFITREHAGLSTSSVRTSSGSLTTTMDRYVSPVRLLHVRKLDRFASERRHA